MKLGDIIFWGKVFLGWITIEGIALFCIEVAIINDLKHDPDQKKRTARTVYAILLIVSLVFFLIFAWDGVLNENSIQLVTFLFFSALMTVYAFVQLVGDFSNALLIAQFLVLFLGELGIFVLGYKVYSEFGWKVYKKVGADPRMRSLFRIYLILMTLTKLDFALAIILIAQNTAIALKPSDPEFGLNIAAILLVFALSISVALGARMESNPLMYIFFALSPLEPAYIIFKIVRLATVPRFSKLPRTQLITSGVVAIILRIILVVIAFKSKQNFGKGLDRYVRGNADARGAGGGAATGGNGAAKGTQLEPAKRRSTYDVNSLGSYNSNRVIQMDE
eukprot:c16801_g2_i1.p1 GENE.c16801_g2_i1~~c16801_g2_i1.p1  ORF type:complete len:334 (+),score=69.85 c16801_g2_i1:186-1187(+)